MREMEAESQSVGPGTRKKALVIPCFMLHIVSENLEKEKIPG
jgi:hypothetical protein